MTSILTNNSAMNALSTLRNLNNNLDSTQNRISTGLKVNSGKDNAAYFQISSTMKGDSSTYNSINESLTLTKNSITTARLGSETIQGLAQQFLDKVAFSQGAEGGLSDIENDLSEIVKRMETTLGQSTFNGDDLLAAGDYSTAAGATVDTATGELSARAANTATTPDSREVVTGVSRAGGTFATTSITVGQYDMGELVADFKALATSFGTNADDDTPTTTAGGDPSTQGADFRAGALKQAETILGDVTDISTKLGQSEAAIEGQQEFLNKLSDNIDAGVGAMIDANMEEEAARLQALQVQQQLATQSLTMANQKPQNILGLFR